MRRVLIICLLAMLVCSGTFAKNAKDAPVKKDYYDLLSNDGWLMHWPKNKFPLKIYIEDGSAVSGYRSQFRDILLSAFYSWTDAGGGRLGFTRAASREDADIICIWTKTSNSDAEFSSAKPNAGASIYESFEEAGVGNINILKVRIKLPVRRPTDGLPVTNAEMKCTCLHEIGHALGIDIHSPSTADMMYRFNNAFKVKPVLSKRDVHTIQRLYRLFD